MSTLTFGEFIMIDLEKIMSEQEQNQQNAVSKKEDFTLPPHIFLQASNTPAILMMQYGQLINFLRRKKISQGLLSKMQHLFPDFYQNPENAILNEQELEMLNTSNAIDEYLDFWGELLGNFRWFWNREHNWLEWEAPDPDNADYFLEKLYKPYKEQWQDLYRKLLKSAPNPMSEQDIEEMVESEQILTNGLHQDYMKILSSAFAFGVDLSSQELNQKCFDASNKDLALMMAPLSFVGENTQDIKTWVDGSDLAEIFTAGELALSSFRMDIAFDTIIRHDVIEYFLKHRADTLFKGHLLLSWGAHFTPLVHTSVELMAHFLLFDDACYHPNFANKLRTKILQQFGNELQLLAAMYGNEDEAKEVVRMAFVADVDINVTDPRKHLAREYEEVVKELEQLNNDSH